jgi:hypothetical protein
VLSVVWEEIIVGLAAWRVFLALRHDQVMLLRLGRFVGLVVVWSLGADGVCAQIEERGQWLIFLETQRGKNSRQ